MKKLPMENVNAEETAEMKDKKVYKKPGSILEAFEIIVEYAEDSCLNKDFFDKAADCVRYASRKLKLTPMQVVLLALFVDKSEERCIMMSEIARYTGCRTTRFLRLADDIDILESKRYLRASRSNNSISYRVPAEVLHALRKSEPYQHEGDTVTDTSSFFDAFARIMEERDADELTYDALVNQTKDFLEQIDSSLFARNLRRYGLDEPNLILFIFMAHLFVENNDDNIGFQDIDDIYDNNEIPRYIKSALRTRQLPLFKKNLIENVHEDGMARSDAFKLTDTAKEEFLLELNLKPAESSQKGLTKHETLAFKKLIYNKEEADQIATLTSLLKEDRFGEVQARLRKAGMRQGFCCLFYGIPGTGKTETVYQIAKTTGRDILQVDVDKIKSCWVGESEKNIKVLFDRYRKICKNTHRAPILLFNEADAILGVRMEGASKAVDKMENSIQNIILQEMESLEGILIATTNLTTNLDKAFERRFLYKIRYEKPSESVRSKIWQIMLPGLSESDAANLASRFDLSGGEMENIVRKHSVNAILSGKELIDLPAIIELCRHERISSGHRESKIGF